jgi:DNA-binding IclR family transcriptional regulator
LLAWLDEAELSSILKSSKFRRFTPETLTTAATLRERLNETRAQGFAVSRGELDAEVLGIAAPIFSLRGQAVAAITLAALSSRIGDAEIPAIAVAVRAAAAQISSVYQRDEQ